jgi:nicotinate-nucleotide--dimethylbenzimidazole phosphoribosyltransferase
VDSTARFLLGGALGAALGYLLSQKNLEKAIQSGQLSVPATGSAGAQRADGGPQAFAPAVAVAPRALAPQDLAVSAPAPAAPARESTIPPAPAADWRPAPQPPAAAPLSAVPVSAPHTPLVEAPVPEPQVQAEAPESEVIITRDFLEEPIPGSGWRSSAPAAPLENLEDSANVGASTTLADEQTVRELPVAEEVAELPVVEEHVADSVAAGSPAVILPNEVAAAPQERAAFRETMPVDTPSRVDDLKSRIEETRRRIRHELEQPFDTAVTSAPPERDWAFSTALPPPVGETVLAEAAATRIAPEAVAPEPVAVEPPAVEPALVEPIAVEPVALGPVTMETVTVEAVDVEAVPVETIALEEVAVEPVAIEPVAVEEIAVEPVLPEPVAVGPATVETIAVEPAVAEPVVVEPVTVEAAPVEAAPVSPAAVEPITVEPAVAGPVAIEPVPAEPVAAEQVMVAADRAEAIAESMVVTAETAGEEADLETGLDQPVDYDSMKDRIETTRSRLKAKAFDAMMTGESALLGRDLGGAERSHPKMPGVDSDIDQTIETSLREEEQ